MKAFTNFDLSICRGTPVAGNHYVITAEEEKEVAKLTNDSATRAYRYYKTLSSADAEDVSDETMAKVLGWTEKTAKNYRLMLTNANLILFAKEGQHTIVYVGRDRVSLKLAGLPADVQNDKLLKEVKKKLGIQNSEELVSRIDEVNQYYTNLVKTKG